MLKQVKMSPTYLLNVVPCSQIISERKKILECKKLTNTTNNNDYNTDIVRADSGYKIKYLEINVKQQNLLLVLF